jgi:hypothetical protein
MISLISVSLLIVQIRPQNLHFISEILQKKYAFNKFCKKKLNFKNYF